MSLLFFWQVDVYHIRTNKLLCSLDGVSSPLKCDAGYQRIGVGLATAATVTLWSRLGLHQLSTFYSNIPKPLSPAVLGTAPTA